MKIEVKDHWFGEWVDYNDQIDKIRALIYLDLWKNFFLKKVECLELIDADIVDKPKSDTFLEKNTIGIKLHMRGIKPDWVISLS
jgi:hypothetical protein